MRVESVTFGFTKNLGNFHSARADVTIAYDGELRTAQEMLTLARALVREELDMPIDSSERAALQEYESITKSLLRP